MISFVVILTKLGKTINRKYNADLNYFQRAEINQKPRDEVANQSSASVGMDLFTGHYYLLHCC
jgi:hypothetical protein